MLVIAVAEGYGVDGSQVLYFVEEFDAFVDELLRCGVLVQIDIFAVAAVVAHLDSQDARMCSTLLMKQCVA